MIDSVLANGLEEAVARGLLGRGQARRTMLAASLGAAWRPADPGPAPFLSGEECGRLLGLSRAGVHKHVEQLRSLGFAVASVPGAGYRLERPFTDLLAAEAVLPLLLERTDLETTWVVGLPYEYVGTCPSTNQALKQAASCTPSGALMVTDEQTGGRGRLGRTWVSQAGQDLTFSVLLRPSLGPAQAHLLSLAAALAVAEVLETVPGLKGRVGVKWPNDVLVGDRKICGILLEGSMDADRLHWVVAGIGLNVNGDPAIVRSGLRAESDAGWPGRPRATSLRAETGGPVPRAPLLAALLARLAQVWIDPANGGCLTGLRERDVLMGQVVEVLSGPPDNRLLAVGTAAGIGSEGQLLIRTSAGRTIPVFAGDVTIRGRTVNRRRPSR